ALVLRRVGVSAAQHEDPVREMARGGPDLLPVDHPLVAVEHGARAEVAEVAARVRLRVPLAPTVLAREDARDEMTLLLLGSPLEQGVADHLDREHVVDDAGRHTGALELLREDHLLERGEATTAVLLRPVRREVSVLVQRAPPLLRERCRLLTVERADALPARGQVL